MARQTQTEKNPALDKLVLDRAENSAFSPFFKSRREAIKYFADAHARLNSLRSAVGPCVCCGIEPASNVAAYRWDAHFFDGIGFGPLQILLLFVGHIGVKVKSEVVSFNTFHPICDACRRKMKQRRAVAIVLNFFGLFLVIIAGATAALGWGGVVYFDKPVEKREMLMIALPATGVTTVGLLCLFWSTKALRVPFALRYLASRPIFSHSVKIASRIVE